MDCVATKCMQSFEISHLEYWKISGEITLRCVIGTGVVSVDAGWK